jgi:hypothetical protein
MDEARASGVFALPQLSDVALRSAIATRQVVDSRAIGTRLLTGLHGVEERAARALELLCAGCGAASGHLYLYRGDGLELAASRGPSAASAELHLLVLRHAKELLTSAEQNTVLDTANAPQQATRWLDARGISHQFALLAAEDGESRLCAGVAVIEHRGPAAFRGIGRLGGEIAAELLRAGDANGIPDDGSAD